MRARWLRARRARASARAQISSDPFFSGDAEMRIGRAFRPNSASNDLGYRFNHRAFAAFLDSQARPRFGGNQGRFTTRRNCIGRSARWIERVFGAKSTTATGQRSAEHAAECPEGKEHVNAISWRSKRTRLRGWASAFLVDVVAKLSMPFIRYRTKIAAICRRELFVRQSLSLMRLEIARHLATISCSPVGRWCTGILTHLMYGSDGIVNFQFHQPKLDESFVDCARAGQRSGAAEKIQESIRQIERSLPTSIRIEVR